MLTIARYRKQKIELKKRKREREREREREEEEEKCRFQSISSNEIRSRIAIYTSTNRLNYQLSVATINNTSHSLLIIITTEIDSQFNGGGG